MSLPAPPLPPTVRLARLPTPIEPLPRLSAEIGIELSVKRDDLTGLGLTGNKVRKLEHLLAEARAQGCDAVITCGGAQSNHARATAIAARKLGMSPHLVLRGEAPPVADGNLLLDALVGAEIRWITRPQWAERDAIMAEEARRLAALGRRAYVIPEGGSSALGSWGYVRAALEIARAEAAAEVPFDVVVCATGSGGTQAGLTAGKALLERPWRVLGFAVCDDRAYFEAKVRAILEGMDLGARLDAARRAIEVNDAYIGAGYALSRPDELAAIARVARTEGLFLDPVYTGKAMHGLLSEVRAGRIAAGSRVLFVHTGGIFGLFPKAAELAEAAATT